MRHKADPRGHDFSNPPPAASNGIRVCSRCAMPQMHPYDKLPCQWGADRLLKEYPQPTGQRNPNHKSNHNPFDV